MRDIIRKADVLIEALPYIKKFRGKYIVIKYGGSAMENANSIDGILLDVIFMNYVGLKPVLVHGGGPAINKYLSLRNKKIKFVNGFRITDKETMKIVNKVLTDLNNHIVKRIRTLGGRAVGLHSAKSYVIRARPHKDSKNLGFVGEVRSINLKVINKVFEQGSIPVLCPIGVGADRKPYNINADEVASKLSIALKAEKLAVLTDIRGILRHLNDEDSLIATLRANEIDGLIKRGIIQKGMLPKVAACREAIKYGVTKAHIIDARLSHALLLEIFTDKGIGTQIIK